MIRLIGTFIDNKMQRIILTLLMLVLASPGFCLSSNNDTTGTTLPEYYTPENVLKFADHLFNSGDYLRAAGEYQRYLFLAPRSVRSDSIYYRIVKAVFLGEDYDRCDHLLAAFPNRYPHAPVGADIPLFRAIVKFKQRDYSGSLSLSRSPGISDTKLKRVVVATNYLYLGDFESAKEWSCQSSAHGLLNIDDPSQKSADAILDLCDRATAAGSLPFKSKLLAGALSTLVPGVGKIYCRRLSDGLYSLLIVGLMAWQAYDGFDEDGAESTKGWICGILGSGFYLGNIYGSVIAADLHNRRIHENFLLGLHIEITLP